MSIAGHIPGAINKFWKDVLDENGRWKTTGVLKEHYEEICHSPINLLQTLDS